MNKYIPADKLIAEIERRIGICKRVTGDERNEEDMKRYYQGKVVGLEEIRHLAASLQQEQPDLPSGEEVMTMCNQILIDWVKEGKTQEEVESREEAHSRFFELYDEYLMQEQPEQPRTCKTCSLFENDCPFVRGKFIPYPSKGCKDYTAEEVQP